MVTGDGGHNVYPGSGPLDGGKTLLPACLILMIWVLQELIYHEIGKAKPYKLAYGMIVVVLWTKPSGLYRHRRELGLHGVGYKGGDLHIRIAKLAFHTKESSIWTRDAFFNLVSS